MPDPTPATSDYTMGYSEEFLQLLDRRSAETHAAYLLRHLKPGHPRSRLRLWAGDHHGRSCEGG